MLTTIRKQWLFEGRIQAVENKTWRHGEWDVNMKNVQPRCRHVSEWCRCHPAVLEQFAGEHVSNTSFCSVLSVMGFNEASNEFCPTRIIHYYRTLHYCRYVVGVKKTPPSIHPSISLVNVVYCMLLMIYLDVQTSDQVTFPQILRYWLCIWFPTNKQCV